MVPCLARLNSFFKKINTNKMLTLQMMIVQSSLMTPCSSHSTSYWSYYQYLFFGRGVLNPNNGWRKFILLWRQGSRIHRSTNDRSWLVTGVMDTHPPPMFIDYCLFSVYVLLSREWGWQQSAGSLSAPSHSSLQRVLSPLLQFPDIGPIKVLHAPNIPCQGNAGACTLFVPRPTWRGLALSCRGPDLQDLAGGAGWATVIAVSLTWAVIFLPQVTASPISYSVSDRCHPCTVPLSAWIS